MKYAAIMIALVVLSVVFVSGCATMPDTGGGTTGELTAAEKENLAYQSVEDEIDQAIENMDLEDLENEILS